MEKSQTNSNESQMHLEAMLYLLEDPALERESFEARLANDSKLAEVLAEAVSVFHNMQSVEFDSQAQSRFAVPLAAVRLAQGSVVSYRRWQSILAIAASLLLIGFFGWQAFDAMRSPSSEIAFSGSDSGTLNRVVWAWGELQTDNSESRLIRDAGESDFENTLAMLEPTSESDVPEWLVLATAATVDDSDYQDEGKAIIQ